MNKIWPTILIIGLGAIWGLHFSLMKLAAQSGIKFPELSLVLLVSNALIFGVYAKIKHNRIKFIAGSWWFYAGCGAFGYLTPFYLELFSAPKIGAGNLAIFVSLTPIVTLLLALTTRSEKITARKLCGITLGFLGIVPIVFQHRSAGSNVSLDGFLGGLAVPCMYGIYHNFVSKFWPKSLNSAEVSVGETIFALMLMVPIYATHLNWPDLSAIAVRNFVVIPILIIASACEIFLYFKIIRELGPISVSQVNYVTVVAGIFWGALMFGESLNSGVFVSIFLVGVALWLVMSSA